MPTARHRNRPTAHPGYRKPIILVSSAVHGIESLLDQVYAVLDGFGYTVWMSYKGTIPVDPSKSNFENCIAAVDNCDLFLGIITGEYGSGRMGGEDSITHREMLRAIAKDKLRWFLVHHNVDVARQLLKQFRTPTGRWKTGFHLERNPILEDRRIIDMYEAAVRKDVPLGHRTGNWVQPYFTPKDAITFVTTQFESIKRLSPLLGRPAV